MMMSLMNLLPTPPAEIVQGRVIFEGRDVRAMPAEELRALRGGEIGFVFQDPMTSLNPVFTVGFQLIEPLREHLGLSKAEARERAAERAAMPERMREALKKQESETRENEDWVVKPVFGRGGRRDLPTSRLVRQRRPRPHELAVPRDLLDDARCTARLALAWAAGSKAPVRATSSSR